MTAHRFTTEHTTADGASHTTTVTIDLPEAPGCDGCGQLVDQGEECECDE
jgi:hypothetical protein